MGCISLRSDSLILKGTNWEKNFARSIEHLVKDTGRNTNPQFKCELLKDHERDSRLKGKNVKKKKYKPKKKKKWDDGSM